MDSWSFACGTGPEFREPGRGTYALEEIPCEAATMAAIDLKPSEIATFLGCALRHASGLAGLPDLRDAHLTQQARQ